MQSEVVKKTSPKQVRQISARRKPICPFSPISPKHYRETHYRGQNLMPKNLFKKGDAYLDLSPFKQQAGDNLQCLFNVLLPMFDHYPLWGNKMHLRRG